MLVFESIDGAADVFLNGTFLGTTDNAFHPWQFKIAGIVKPINNQLFLRFRSIDSYFGGTRKDDLTGYTGIKLIQGINHVAF